MSGLLGGPMRPEASQTAPAGLFCACGLQVCFVLADEHVANEGPNTLKQVRIPFGSFV